jgi:4'-phosphopantetheinyl transferase EntD
MISDAPRTSARLTALFPAGVATAELSRPGDRSRLFPEEARHVERASPKRVSEFAAGRMCARHALAQLGMIDVVLGATADRRPNWPASVVGSITHTDGFCGVVVAERRRFRSVGCDAEIIGRVTSEILSQIGVPTELGWIGALPDERKALAGALIFAAKEAFYKCQFPVTEEWLDFQDVALNPESVDFESGEFTLAPVKQALISRHASMPLAGRFWSDDRLIITGIWVAAD